jgi:hypothetical protein
MSIDSIEGGTTGIDGTRMKRPAGLDRVLLQRGTARRAILVTKVFRMPVPSRIARASLSFAALTVVVALSACSNPVAPRPSQPSSSTTAKAAAPASATPTPTSDAIPVGLDCAQVITQEQMEDFDTASALSSDYTPKDGSLPAQVVAAKGVACAWTNPQTGKLVEVAVARTTPTSSNTLQNAAVTEGTPVPTYGTPPDANGYFGLKDGTGTVQLFTKGFWVVAQSPDFAEPGDPAPLIASVVGNLPS